MIRCEEILREISNYIDEDITPELRRQVEQHLGDCRRCTVLVNTTRKTLTLVADNYVLELPREVAERLMNRLNACWGTLFIPPPDNGLERER